jgi:hypothetical protein
MTKFKTTIVCSAIATTGLPEIIPQAVPCIARSKQNETLSGKTKCAANTTCDLLNYQQGKGEKFRDCGPWRGKLQNPSRIHRKNPPLHHAFTVALVRHPPL